MLSLFPSLEIDISVFEKCFYDKNIKNKLIKLEKNGWLDKKENSFKLHQIIKEYLKRKEELDYEKVKLIFKRIAEFINPDDSTVNANSLIYYIPIIESFLNDYERYEDEYIIGLNDSLTFLYYSLAKYEKALDIQDRMLELRERLFGKDNNEYAKGLNLKAAILNELRRYNEAIDIHNKVISIRENKENLNIDLAISWNNMSTVYEKLGKYNLSLDYAIKALKINELVLDKNHISLSINYGNISLIYSKLNKNDLSLEYSRKALKIIEKTLDNNYIFLAVSYGNISMIYRTLKKYNTSLDFGKKALKLNEEILDKNHPELARTYLNLGCIYKDLKECKKAKEHIEKAKNIYSL